MHLLLQIYDLFFPRTCVCCTKPLINQEKHFCIECLIDLPIIHNDEQSTELLERKFWGKVQINETASFLKFRKKGMVARILNEIKYNNQPELAIYLGEKFAETILDSQRIFELDYLIPIPLHKARLNQRGYNQAEYFAQGIANKTGIEVCKNVLIRIKNNVSQTSLKERFARFKNIEDSFQLINLDKLKGKSVALVDDVLTTGSTIESAAKTLINADVKKVNVFTLATAV